MESEMDGEREREREGERGREREREGGWVDGRRRVCLAFRFFNTSPVPPRF